MMHLLCSKKFFSLIVLGKIILCTVGQYLIRSEKIDFSITGFFWFVLHNVIDGLQKVQLIVEAYNWLGSGVRVIINLKINNPVKLD